MIHIVFINNNIDWMGSYCDGDYIDSFVHEWVDGYDNNGDFYSYLEDAGILRNGVNCVMCF